MKPFRYLPKAIRVLLISNLVVFGITFVLGSIMGLTLNLPGIGYGTLRQYVVYFGAFFPDSPLEVWRYFTYMFVHVDFWHFLFNMLMLWMFGDEVAEWMGVRHFTCMYLFCGVFAALFSFLLSVVGFSNNPIIGASGALMGIFVAYYKFFPERRLLLFFFFPMRIKYAMWVLVAVDVLMAGSGDGVAHLAHLGGVVAGFVYMWLYEGGFMKLRMKKPKFDMYGESSRNKAGTFSDDDALEGEVFYVDEQKRMDEILSKVNRNGIHSLSASEREFLLKAGERFRKRR